MRNKLVLSLIRFALTAGILFLSASAPLVLAQKTGKLRVATSLFPLQEFAQAVGGENVQSDLLLPPGVEPHTWEPKPSDVAKIAAADIFIYIGPMMEPWAANIIKAAGNANLRVVEASRGLELLRADGQESDQETALEKHHPGGWDPHVWLDFSIDRKIIDSVAAAFTAKDPQHASLYRSRAENYKDKLTALDQKYSDALSKCQNREIILGGHSAFAYLARRYGLKQVALYGVSPNAEPTPKKLTSVIETSRRHKAKYIFFETLVNPKLALVLAKEAGVGTLVLHAGHNLTKDQQQKNVTFLDLMASNLGNLTRGLECHGS